MSKRKDMLDALRRKQKQREARRLPVRAQDEVAVRLREIVTAMEEGPMAEFPGACHASVARPDLLKFEFATLLMIDGNADDVGWQHIAGELNSLKRAIQRFCQRVR